VASQAKELGGIDRLQARRLDTAVAAKRAQLLAAAAAERAKAVQHSMAVLRENCMPAPHFQFDGTGLAKHQKRVRTHRLALLPPTVSLHLLPRSAVPQRILPLHIAPARITLGVYISQHPSTCLVGGLGESGTHPRHNLNQVLACVMTARPLSIFCVWCYTFPFTWADDGHGGVEGAAGKAAV
jgi:hypothetical protein